MRCTIRFLAVVSISLGIVIVWSWCSGPSPEQRLNDELDRFERIETARLSAAGGEIMMVTVTLDSIERLRDRPGRPLLAVVHLKRNGLEYDRRSLLYERDSEAWTWERETPGAVAKSAKQDTHPQGKGPDHELLNVVR